MIISDKDINKIVSGNIQGGKDFTISTTSKAFNILSSNIYSNKIRAIIREICCNAIDSHISVGNDKPFDVRLPNSINREFVVRDYGSGLSNEDVMELYTTYFNSTKTSSNLFTGALGLGSKSPFSYTDIFTTISYFNGKKTTFQAFIDSGVPKIKKIVSVDTDEPNGLEVRVPVDGDDIDRWKFEAEYVFQTFTTIEPNVSGNKIEYSKIITNDRGYILLPKNNLFSKFGTLSNKFQGGIEDIEHINKKFNLHESQIYAIMGGVLYPINNIISYLSADEILRIKDNILIGDNNILSKGGLLFIEFDIGELDVEPGREGLSYDKRTIGNILNKIEFISKDIINTLKESIIKTKSKFELFRLYTESTSIFKVGSVLSGLFNFTDGGLRIENIDIKHPKFDILDVVETYTPIYNNSKRNKNDYDVVNDGIFYFNLCLIGGFISKNIDDDPVKINYHIKYAHIGQDGSLGTHKFTLIDNVKWVVVNRTSRSYKDLNVIIRNMKGIDDGVNLIILKRSKGNGELVDGTIELIEDFYGSEHKDKLIYLDSGEINEYVKANKNLKLNRNKSVVLAELHSGRKFYNEDELLEFIENGKYDFITGLYYFSYIDIQDWDERIVLNGIFQDCDDSYNVIDYFKRKFDLDFEVLKLRSSFINKHLDNKLIYKKPLIRGLTNSFKDRYKHIDISKPHIVHTSHHLILDQLIEDGKVDDVVGKYTKDFKGNFSDEPTYAITQLEKLGYEYHIDATLASILKFIYSEGWSDILNNSVEELRNYLIDNFNMTMDEELLNLYKSLYTIEYNFRLYGIRVKDESIYKIYKQIVNNNFYPNDISLRSFDDIIGEEELAETLLSLSYIQTVRYFSEGSVNKKIEKWDKDGKIDLVKLFEFANRNNLN